MKTFKIFLFLLSPVVATLLLAGCGDSSSSSSHATNEVSSGNPITAPVDYLGAVGEAQKKMVKTIDTVALTSAIQQFNAAEERLPSDLNELVSKGYIREIPKAPYGYKITYDATTGTAKVVKQ